MSFPPSATANTDLRRLLSSAEWEAVIARILRRHAVSPAGLAPFASGSDVVWGTPTHVVKLSNPPWAWQIAAEARWAEALAGRLPVATPTLVAHGALEGWPYVVVERLPGRAIGTVWSTLDAGERRALAAALGEVVAALHAVPVDDDGDWAAWRDRCRGTVASRHAGGLGDGAGAFVDAHLRERPPVIVHTELLDEHVLVGRTASGWAPTGLIDFADARIGDPHYELVAPIEFIWKGDAGCTREFLAALGWFPESPRTLLAWALLHRYGRLARALAIAPDAPSLDALAERVYGWSSAGPASTVGV